jgi:deazaflavin-dependent oxidoreductase (nitroreductase family)
VTVQRPPSTSIDPEPDRQPAPPGGALRALLGLPTLVYRAHLGALLGHRFLMLVSTGRTSGKRRETVLEVMRYDPASGEAVCMAGWGRRTGWLHNVEAGLATEIRIGRERYAPAWRILAPDEAERVLAAYERENGSAGPVIRAVLGRLLGWRYDGTQEARRRAVRQLPLVGFRRREASR